MVIAYYGVCTYIGEIFMAKKRFLILMVTVMLFASTILFACNNTNCDYSNDEPDNGRENSSVSIEFNTSAFGGYFVNIHYFDNKGIATIIRSVSELVSFFDSYEIYWITNPIWEHYDNVFFESYALMLFFFRTTGVLGSQFSLYVESVEFNNNALTLHILSNSYTDMRTDNSIIVPFVVEVYNKDIQDIATFGVNFRLGQQPLSPRVALQIRKDFIAKQARPYRYALDDVNLSYLGTHNGFSVVTIQLITDENGVMQGALPSERIVGGYVFMYSHNAHYLMWREGVFYCWFTSYDEGFLKLEHIRKIYNLLN